MSIKHSLSVNEILQIIQLIKSLNLQEHDIDEIKSLIYPLWVGYYMSTPLLKSNQIIYRGRKFRDRPERLSELSYPPKNIITSDQRANRAGVSRFYCSISKAPPFFELNAKPGDCIVISRWSLNKTIIVGNVGYTSDVFEQYGSIRSEKSIWWNDNRIQTPQNDLVHKFFADAFSTNVPERQEYLYKISIAIAESFLGKALYGSMPNLIDEPIERRMGGLLYPSFATWANIDNLVLLPEFVDQYLEFKNTILYKIDSILDKGYEVTKIDFADSVDNKGNLKWWGRMPNWKMPPGETWLVSVEAGEYVIKNKRGKIIQPT